jgi:hypothetical protein
MKILERKNREEKIVFVTYKEGKVAKIDDEICLMFYEFYISCPSSLKWVH